VSDQPSYDGGNAATATFVAPSAGTRVSDDQVAQFICRGYHLVEPDLRPGLNEEIDAKLTAMTHNPGNAILDAVPQLWEVYGHAMVRGALASVLGQGVTMNEHRHWHNRPPSPWSQGWHQDGTNQRHHHTTTCLAMYYPHDVTVDMGPTVVMPGTHFRNAPTDRMASYGNLRGQVALTVKAGTVAITHYDIWHGGSINRSNRTRHMLKFLFDRDPSERTTPSWNHDPKEGERIAGERFNEWPPFCGQSDHYKQINLRWECWRKMKGEA
jgi:hypothetical protein